jgi:hypothetical protein
MVLRGRWCNIIVLNVHAPTEEKSDDSKDSFCEELEQVFDHFPKYHIKILLGDFNEKLEKEYIFILLSPCIFTHYSVDQQMHKHKLLYSFY